MHKILIVGAGRIGKLIGQLLSEANYHITMVDTQPQKGKRIFLLDITDTKAVKKFLAQHAIDSIVSCLPYYLTLKVAELAAAQRVNYFDLTEDISVSKKIQALAKDTKSAFVPRCGLAPGLVGIFAYQLLAQFATIDTVRLCVGGLPQYAHNALHYAITWSVDGLINQYGNPCHMIEGGKLIAGKPLEYVEELEIDGMLYEAFTTSGGLGNLVELCKGKVRNLCYKTIRYPGHCEKIRFLMNDLRLNEDRATLKRILENAIPDTEQDVVLLDVTVTGKKNGHLHEEAIVKKYYPKEIAGKVYSALQVTTAASAAAVIETVLKKLKNYQGFVYQETLSLTDLQKSHFAKYIF